MASAIALACLAPLQGAVATPPDWNVNPSQYTYDGSITAAVLDGTQSIGAAGDLLGAFVGTECRGVAEALVTPVQTYVFPLQVYSNQSQGESLSFKFYDASLDQIREIVETVAFVPDMILGSPFDPYPLHVTSNTPPNMPANPNPANGAVGVSLNADLAWTGGDPDPQDTVVYHIYFGLSTPPPHLADIGPYPGGTTQLVYTLMMSLQYGRRYYWKIIAEDNRGAATAGPIWWFSTEQNDPPYTPSNPSPSQGAIDVPLDADLSWTGGDPDPMDLLTYDVYFGETNPPALVMQGLTHANYDPGTLDWETTYYWKIVSHDNHGNTTAGPVWHFATVAGSPGPGWWDLAWGCRKELTVQDAVADYQLLLRVFREDGHDNADLGVMDCEGHCNLDFSDLRFIDPGRSTELAYWIEKTGEESGDHFADVWVKTPATSPIYAYYGNAGASSASNGPATFPYHDHWEVDHTADWIRAMPSSNYYHWWENVHSFSDYRAIECITNLVSWNSGPWDHTDLGWCHTKLTYYVLNDFVSVRFSMVESFGATNNIVRVTLGAQRQGNYFWTDFVSVPRPIATDLLKLSLRYAANEVRFEWWNLTTQTLLTQIVINDPLCIPDPTEIPYLFHGQVDYSGGLFIWSPPTSVDWGNLPYNGGCRWRTDYWFVRKYDPDPPRWLAFGQEFSDVGDEGQEGQAWSRMRMAIAPNPFVHEAQFVLETGVPMDVHLSVLDVSGRLQRRLDSPVAGPGAVSLRWDGRDEEGRPLPPGVYFVRLRSGGAELTRRLIRIN